MGPHLARFSIELAIMAFSGQLSWKMGDSGRGQGITSRQIQHDTYYRAWYSSMNGPELADVGDTWQSSLIWRRLLVLKSNPLPSLLGVCGDRGIAVIVDLRTMVLLLFSLFLLVVSSVLNEQASLIQCRCRRRAVPVV